MPWSNQGGGPWGSGGSKGPWGSGPQSSGPTPPDLEELLRRSQDKLKSVLPGGNLGGRGFALLALGAIVLWGVSGFFRVEPDELGVVLRFGKYVREVQPGLNYHLPYPIETVLTPKALRVNKIDVGMRIVDDLRRGTTVRDVPEESLMLTGDENIVDVDFSVLWQIKPNGVGEYLFNIQNPEGTVKAVAESAMREVIGRSDIQPILTGARQNIEAARAGTDAEDARSLRRRRPDPAGADAEGRSAARRSSTPSATCRRRAPTSSARRTRRRPTPTAWCPKRAAGRRRSLQDAEAYREQTVAEATGQTSRFLQDLRRIQEGAGRDAPAHVSRNHGARCSAAPTRSSSIPAAAGGGGVVPYLPLNELTRRAAAPAADGRRPMRARYRRRRRRSSSLIVALVLGYASLFTVYQTQQALVVRLGEPVRVVTEPGLNFKMPLIDSVINIDKRILDLENPAQEVIASDQKRLVVDAFARYRIQRSAALLSDASASIAGRQLAARHAAQLGAAPRARRGDVHPRGARRARAADGAHPRAARPRGRSVYGIYGGRRAHPPRRSAGAEQPGGVSAHADRASARGRRIPRPGQPAVRRKSAPGPIATSPCWSPRRPRKAEQIRGEGDGERNRIFAEAFGKDPGLLRLLPLDAGLRGGHAPQRHAHGAEAGFGVLPLFRRSVGQEPRRIRGVALGGSACTRRRRRRRRQSRPRHRQAMDGWRGCRIFWSRSVWCSPSRECCSPPFPALAEARDGACHWRRPTTCLRMVGIASAVIGVRDLVVRWCRGS